MSGLDSTQAVSTNPIYQPLGPRQTRRVWMRQKNYQLYFELEVISIDSTVDNEEWATNQNYVALSYTWGNHDSTGVAVKATDGNFYAIYVTKTLLVACDTILRSNQQFVPFWIDQLSIDQGNGDEKISQIRMMHDIYEASYKVLVWLGPSSIDSTIGMAKIRQIRREFHQVARAGEDYETDDGLIVPKFLEVLAGPQTEENFQAWKAMLNLIDRPWFSRIWILQESSAKTIFRDKTLVACGEDLALLDDFVRFYRLIANIVPWYWDTELTQFLIKAQARNRSTFNVICDFWMSKQMYTWFPLLKLLNKVRDFDAFDVRDKLFAMTSFATDIRFAEHPLEMSYDVSLEESFINFVLWQIREYGDLDFLGSVQRPSSTDSTDRLPDWVPDWGAKTITPTYSYYERSNWNVRTPLYLACGQDRLRKLSINGNIEDPGQLQALTLSGVRLSTVKPWIPRIEDCEEFGIMMQKQCPLNSIELMQVFSRTMCADVYGGVGSDHRTSNYRRAYYQPHESCPKGHKDCFCNYHGAPGLTRNMNAAHQGRAFFMLQPTEEEDYGVIGLGDKDLRADDQIWMFEGGKMLYILRPWSLPGSGPTQIRNLDVTGGPNSKKGCLLESGTTVYQYIGEAFVLGLMDGEIIDMLGDLPKRTRPTCLSRMDRDFRTINILSPRGYSWNQHVNDQKLKDEKSGPHFVQARLGFVVLDESIEQFTDKAKYWTPGEKPPEMDPTFVTVDMNPKKFGV